MPSQETIVIGQTKPSTDADKVRNFLHTHPEVRIISIQWVDICGVVRNRMTSAQKFLDMVVRGDAFNQSPVDMLMTTTSDVVPEVLELFCEARSRIVPDISSLRSAAYDSAGIGNVATVMGDVDWRNLDARTNLRRKVEEARWQHKLQFLIGFELEICFLKRDVGRILTPVGPMMTGGSLSSATQRSSLWPVLNEILVALQKSGILAEQLLKEYGPAQWELALSPLPPVDSVDAYVYATEVVRNIAYKHGLVATLYPTPILTEGAPSPGTSGQHIHISATKIDAESPDGSSGDWNPDGIMASILCHLPALTALGLPQLDSYERVGAGKMATGGFVAWGDHHRDMPLRRIERNHWEFRTNDATSNPYAVVAGLVAAAMDPQPLIMRSPTKFTPFLSKRALQDLGITRPLPATFREALQEVRQDRAWMNGALGKEYVDWFLILKQAELETLGKMNGVDRTHLMVSHF